MNEKIKSAFDGVVADEALRRKTEARVLGRMERKPVRPRGFGRRLAGAVAALVLALGALGAYSAYALPVSYIDIDVNPSVELALNRFDRVVGATGKNDEGAAVLEGLPLKNMTYTDAVDAVLDSAAEKGYLTDGGEAVFTVTSKNEEALTAGIRACEGFARYRCRFGNQDNGAWENGGGRGCGGSAGGANGCGSENGGGRGCGGK